MDISPSYATVLPENLAKTLVLWKIWNNKIFNNAEVDLPSLVEEVKFFACFFSNPSTPSSHEHVGLQTNVYKQT